MKRKDFLKEIANLDKASLEQRAAELAEEMMRLRFKKATSQLENPNRLRDVRRSLARVSTLLSQKGLLSQKASVAA
jgi:large subunit ribosomal protein L29